MSWSALRAAGLGVVLALGAPAQDPVFVDLSVEPRSAVVGQTVTVRARIGIEATFRREALVSLFRQTLAWPVQFEAPWWDELAGARRVADSEPVDGPACVVNDRAARGQLLPSERRGERNFDVLQLTRRFVATAPGELRLAGATLRYAYATQFTEDFLQGRVPTDRREGRADAPELRVAVVDLPPDAPAGFSGAVGEFTITAQAHPLTARVGQALKLTVTIRGAGDLDSFRAPRLDGGDDLRVLGMVEERAEHARKIVYELVPRHAQVRALPPVALVHYLPGDERGGFRTARSEPIAITVLDADGKPGDSGRGATAASSPPLLREAIGGRPPSRLTVLLTLCLPFLWASLLWSWRRARARRAADPAGERARQALLRARAELQAPGADAAVVLADYLAARLRSSAASVLSPGLAQRLQGAGLAPALAARASDALDALSAARYGGTATQVSLAPLLDELDAAFKRAGAKR